MPNPMDALMRQIARNAEYGNRRHVAWLVLIPEVGNDHVRDYAAMDYGKLQNAILGKHEQNFQRLQQAIPAVNQTTTNGWAVFYSWLVETDAVLLDGTMGMMRSGDSVESIAEAFGGCGENDASIGIFKGVFDVQSSRWNASRKTGSKRPKSLLVYMLLCCTLGLGANRHIEYNRALTWLGLPVVDFETDPIDNAGDAAPEPRAAEARWRISMVYKDPDQDGKKSLEEAFVPATGGRLAVGRSVVGDNVLLVPGGNVAAGGGSMSREHFVLETSEDRKGIRLVMPDGRNVNPIWVYPKAADPFEVKGGYAYLGNGWQFSVQPPGEGLPSASMYPVFSVEKEGF